jgi:predicted glycoside hydrolase/deacetylase ChbG (UPF0249 family)
MKLIIRADDVGYTDVHNIATFEMIEKGCVTSADIMLDTPGTVGALERLREFPWISVGWHAHFLGSPVLDMDRVPTLVDRKTGHFRTDLHTAEDISRDELLVECRAQMDRCVKILGRVPDTGSGRGDSIFGQVLRKICTEYGIAQNFSFSNFMGHTSVPDARWVDCKITMSGFKTINQAIFANTIDEQMEYHPIAFFTEDQGGILPLMKEGNTVMTAWHPSYVDYYVTCLGDYGPLAKNFLLCRAMDTAMLCSDELKKWILDNHVEFVNFRDALYGTQEYQNHLRVTGSALCML